MKTQHKLFDFDSQCCICTCIDVAVMPSSNGLRSKSLVSSIFFPSIFLILKKRANAVLEIAWIALTLSMQSCRHCGVFSCAKYSWWFIPCTVVAVRNANSTINTINVLWKILTPPPPSILLKFHIMTPPEILLLIIFAFVIFAKSTRVHCRREKKSRVLHSRQYLCIFENAISIDERALTHSHTHTNQLFTGKCFLEYFGFFGFVVHSHQRTGTRLFTDLFRTISRIHIGIASLLRPTNSTRWLFLLHCCAEGIRSITFFPCSSMLVAKLVGGTTLLNYKCTMQLQSGDYYIRREHARKSIVFIRDSIKYVRNNCSPVARTKWNETNAKRPRIKSIKLWFHIRQIYRENSICAMAAVVLFSFCANECTFRLFRSIYWLCVSIRSFSVRKHHTDQHTTTTSFEFREFYANVLKCSNGEWSELTTTRCDGW